MLNQIFLNFLRFKNLKNFVVFFWKIDFLITQLGWRFEKFLKSWVGYGIGCSTQEHTSLPKILTRDLSELRIFSVIRNPDLLSFFCVLSYIVRPKNRPEKYVKSLLFKKAIYVLSNLFEWYIPLSQAVIYLRLTKNNNTKPICYSLKSFSK